MSIMTYYVRGPAKTIELISRDQASVFEDPPIHHDVEMIDIDAATEGLAWLGSPLQRAEVAYLHSLITDPNLSDEDIAAQRAELDLQVPDDVLAAIQGSTAQPIDATPGVLGAALFVPSRVPGLAAALAALSEERLRVNLNFELMDSLLIAPSGWLTEGEDIFRSYLLPGLKRLQRFYRAAADAGHAVVVLAV